MSHNTYLKAKDIISANKVDLNDDGAYDGRELTKKLFFIWPVWYWKNPRPADLADIYGSYNLT